MKTYFLFPILFLALTACRTRYADFSIPDKTGNRSFYAFDETSFFLGIDPEGPVSAIIVKSCAITYTTTEIVARIQAPVNFFLEREIPESEYPEGFVFVRISDPGNRPVFVQINDSSKLEVPMVGAMKFPQKTNTCQTRCFSENASFPF